MRTPSVCEAPRGVALLHVGARDVELERAQDLGEAAHADAADADEVHVPDATAKHQLRLLRSASPARADGPSQIRRIASKTRCVGRAERARRPSAMRARSSAIVARGASISRGEARRVASACCERRPRRPRGERQRVLALVIVGGERERNEDRGAADRADLGERAGAGARDDQSAAPSALGDVVDERHDRARSPTPSSS